MVGTICSPGWDRVKISENLGATVVTPVAPVDTSLADVQGGRLAGRLTCDRAGRQNGTHHRETQSALQTLVMEDDHQIAFNSQAIRVLLQHKNYDFIKTRWPVV